MNVLLVDYYLSSTWKQALWILMSGAFVTLVLWVRIGKPLVQRRRPWTVVEVTAERGQTTTLTLRATGHDGFRFAPGQYGVVRDRPLVLLDDEAPVLVLLKR